MNDPEKCPRIERLRDASKKLLKHVQGVSNDIVRTAQEDKALYVDVIIAFEDAIKIFSNKEGFSLKTKKIKEVEKEEVNFEDVSRNNIQN